jgi:hypothetical protein
MNGAPVVDLASFNAAVATLRSPAGHDISPAGVAAWTTPPLWSKVELTLATTDVSAPSEEIDGNVNATIASLASIGFVPLVVTQVSCASFDFATMDNTQAAYWGERWCASLRGALRRLCAMRLLTLVPLRPGSCTSTSTSCRATPGSAASARSSVRSTHAQPAAGARRIADAALAAPAPASPQSGTNLI